MASALRSASIAVVLLVAGGSAWAVSMAESKADQPAMRLLAGALAAAALVAGLVPLFARPAVTAEQLSKSTAQTNERLNELSAKIDKAMAALDAGKTANGAVPDAQVQAAQREAVEAVLSSNDPADERSKRALEDGNVGLAYESLLDSARQHRADGARRYREAGLLIYGTRATEAAAAFREAVRQNPSDAWSRIYLSRLSLVIGDTKEAEKHAREALLASVDARERGGSFTALGDALRAAGDLRGAREAFEKGLPLKADFARGEPENGVWLRDLSIGYERLGDVARDEGDLAGARTAYDAGLAIAQNLAARDPANIELQRDLSICHNKLGDVAGMEGDLPSARRLYEKALDIRAGLLERDPQNAELQRDLAISYVKLGNIARLEGDVVGMREASERSLVIEEALARRDPSNLQWQRDLWAAYGRLGDLAEGRRDIEEAIRLYELGRPIIEALAARDPSHVGFRSDLKFTTGRLAELRNRLT